MSFFAPQNPGIGGLDELTTVEETFLQNIASISYSTGDILYYDGNNLTNLAIGSEDDVLTVSAGGIPEWVAGGGGSGDVTAAANLGDNLLIRGDGATKGVQNSGITVDDSDNVTGVNQLDVDSVNGVDVNPGSDVDADLITVGVTGAPKLQWDESQDSFKFTKGIEIDDNVALTFGTGFDATLQWDGTDLILDYDSQGGGTTDFRIQENGTDRLTIETGGEVGIGETTPLAMLHITNDQAALTELRLDNSNASGSMALKLFDGSNERAQVHYDTAAALLTLGTNIAGGQFRINTAADSEAFRIDASGNITTGVWQGTTIAVNQGGTGQTSYTDGQLLIGNTTGNTLAKATLTEGAGIDITNGSGSVTIAGETASDTNAGIVELATAAETTTGTDTGRAVTPDGLAGSDYGIRIIEILVEAGDTDLATGDSLNGNFVLIPAELDGYNLVSASAAVFASGTTGTTDVQINNHTDSVDILSTVITIASGATYAADGVINTANDDVAEGDVLTVDVDAVSTTAPKGLIVSLGFQKP